MAVQQGSMQPLTGQGILYTLVNPHARIVVMRALRLGDLICATPALRSLRAALPHAHITLIGLSLAHEFVRRCQFLDDFVEFPGYPGIADQDVSPSRTLAFLTQMQEARYDLAIQVHGSGVFSNPFTVLLGAHSTVGFTRPGETDLGLNFSIPYPSSGREVHRLLSLMHALGAPDTGDHTELSVLPEDRLALTQHPHLQKLLRSDAPLVGLHPGAKVATRRWLPERFAAVADHLAETYGATIVITGNKQEWTICEQVRTLMRHPAYNAARQTSLGTLIALIERLHLFIANDSGPSHIAQALNTPCITIFGAANIEDWASPDTIHHRALSVPVSCRPCYLSECPIGYQCLRGVTSEQVLLHATEMLHEQSPLSIE